MSQIACDIAEALELNSSFNYVDAWTINNKLYINNYIHSFSTCNKHVFFPYCCRFYIDSLLISYGVYIYLYIYLKYLTTHLLCFVNSCLTFLFCLGKVSILLCRSKLHILGSFVFPVYKEVYMSVSSISLLIIVYETLNVREMPWFL